MISTRITSATAPITVVYIVNNNPRFLVLSPVSLQSQWLYGRCQLTKRIIYNTIALPIRLWSLNAFLGRFVLLMTFESTYVVASLYRKQKKWVYEVKRTKRMLLEYRGRRDEEKISGETAAHFITYCIETFVWAAQPTLLSHPENIIILYKLCQTPLVYLTITPGSWTWKRTKKSENQGFLQQPKSDFLKI